MSSSHSLFPPEPTKAAGLLWLTISILLIASCSISLLGVVPVQHLSTSTVFFGRQSWNWMTFGPPSNNGVGQQEGEECDADTGPALTGFGTKHVTDISDTDSAVLLPLTVIPALILLIVRWIGLGLYLRN